MFSQALTLNPTMPVMNVDNPNLFYEATGWEAENPVEKLKLEKVVAHRNIWIGTEL